MHLPYLAALTREALDTGRVGGVRYVAAEQSPTGKAGLVGYRCRDCGRQTLEQTRLCPRCRSGAIDEVVLGERGVLVQATTVHQSTAEFEAPYIIGLVRTAEGLRLFAPIGADPREGVAPGTPLELVVRGDGSRPPALYVPVQGETRA